MDACYIHLFQPLGHQMGLAVRDESVNDGLKDDSVRRLCTGIGWDRIKNLNSFIKILLNTPVRIYQRCEVGALDGDILLPLKLFEDIFHRLDVHWLDGTIRIHKKLMSLVRYEKSWNLK